MSALEDVRQLLPPSKRTLYNQNEHILQGNEHILQGTERILQENEHILQRFDGLQAELAQLQQALPQMLQDSVSRSMSSTAAEITALSNALAALGAQLEHLEAHSADMLQRLENIYNLQGAIFYTKRPYHAIEKCLGALTLHPITFGGYRDKYIGRDVVLCGAGPSLSYYRPHEGAVFVAINRAILHEPVQFDYVFSQDFRGISHIQEEMAAYRPEECVKFFGYQDGFESEIPESYARRCNARRFYTDLGIRTHEDLSTDMRASRFALDIKREPLACSWSSAFPALQFILYTRPKRIYLAGIDLAGGHFTAPMGSAEREKGIPAWFKDGHATPEMLGQWQRFKEFANLYYPDTEIISVNPIGLRGLFQDEFTPLFLDAEKQGSV